MKQYRYDAFISYRHNELDSFTAENLHKQLEAFRLPKSVAKKKKEGRKRIERVFRDKDELPLTSNLEDPIIQALKESEYLIVICSPRLRESLWCKREIETFISLHGRDKVLAVLIEGEPDQSFPEALLYKEEKKELPDGTSEIVKVPAEPLAADIRGKDRHAVKKAMKTEILRLLAPMFSVSYDDLRQRHRERKLKRILTASLIAGAICLGFGTISTIMALRIQNQNTMIEQQNTEIQQQNAEIQQQNQSLLISQAINLADESSRQLQNGDREGAISTAYQALTEYEGNTMPYTPQAELALTKSLAAYDSGSYMKPDFQLETDGTELLKLRDVCSSCSESYVTFIGNDRLAYKNTDGDINIYDINSNSLIHTIAVDFVSFLQTDNASKYLLTLDLSNIAVYTTDTYECVYTYTPEENSICNHLFLNEEGTMLLFQEKFSEEDFAIRTLNLDDLTLSEYMHVGNYYLEKVRFSDEVAFLMFNESVVDLSHFQVKVMAYNTRQNQKIWETTYKDQFGSDILIPSAKGANNLLLISSSQAFLINTGNGAESGLLSIGSGMAGGAVYREKDIFILFTRDGVFHNIFGATNQDYVFGGQFQCHSQNVKKFLISSENYLVLPYMDNHITVYNYKYGLDLTDYTEELSEHEDDFLIYDKAVEAAAEMKLKKAALARYFFYDDDKSTAFVVYSNDVMEIYDVASKELLGTCENVTDNPCRFLGSDNLGHTYASGSSYGYMFDEEYNLLAEIEGLEQVNKETGSLVLEDSLGHLYQSSIFTLEELLAKAESYVLR